MSLLGNDLSGTASINGLSNINANNVYSDDVYIDYSTNPINVGDALMVLDLDVSTLQSEINTAQSDINTLQSEMNTAQSDINTLQSEMNTAQSDINDLQTDVGVLYGLTSTNTAAIAGLSVSQAAQDVTLAAHTASIAGLNGDVNSLDNRVDNLEVVTEDQSWGSLSGTTFSRQVHISNTAGSGDAVYLNSSGVSTFLYGLSASAPIISTSGTSQTSSLLVNNNFEVTNNTFFGDTVYFDRNALTSTKKIVLYDDNTGNDYDYLGFWTDSGTLSKKFLNAEIDGVSGSAFQWYYGNNVGTARTLVKQITSASETSWTPTATFLKTSGFSQQIQLIKDAGNNRVRIDMLGDTAGVNSYDGQIIQQEGNGVDDNRGIMTIQSGDVTISAQTSATTGTLQLNSKVLDINASGAITMDGASTTIITSVDDLTIRTTNPFGDILVQSAGTSTFTSSGQTQINSGILDINATGAVTLDTTSTFTTNTTGNTSLTSTSGDVLITGTDVRLNSTGTNTGEVIVRANTNVDIKANTGNVELNANTTMLLTSGGNMTATTTDIGADMNFEAANSLLFKAGTGFWTAQSSSNYYYQAGVDDYNVIYGNQTGSQFLDMTFSSGTPGTVTFNSTSHKVRYQSDIETNLGNDAAVTNIDGSVINLSGNTVQDVDFTNNMMPTATIIQNVCITVPPGFLYCNGQAVSRTTYVRLFAAIGTSFGAGNGTTTFNVPNFLGAYIRGTGSQVVGGVTYAGPAIGTAQQDSVLAPNNRGFWNVDAGGGGASRQVRSRANIGTDPNDTSTSQTTNFARENTTENRVFNYSVYYYIRF